MKKFSFLLAGVLLLGTVAFALADETKDAETTTTAEATTGDTAEITTGDTAEAATGATAEAATGATAEVTTGTTAEAATGATAEAATGTTAEAATGTTAEVTTGDTAEAATGTTAEAATGTTAEVTTGTTAEATTGTTAEVTTGTTAEVTTGDTAEATTGTTAEVTTGTTAEATETATPTISDSAKEKYNEEQIDAYKWAYENGITTINDIEKANLSDGLTRAQLAKMMSQYLTNVLGKTPATTGEKASYADVNESLGDLADFIEIAYAYKIMGINADGTPLKNFNPNGKVTRAEYATVFSRVLYGDKYNKAEGNYYEDHIKALKDAGILSNDNPSIQEVRGWVMLMMYRSVNSKTETTDETATTEESTGDTAEATTGDTAEATTGDTAEVSTGSNA